MIIDKKLHGWDRRIGRRIVIFNYIRINEEIFDSQRYNLDINKTNVPDVRITFRKENLETEFQFLSCGSVNVDDLWRKLSRW